MDESNTCTRATIPSHLERGVKLEKMEMSINDGEVTLRPLHSLLIAFAFMHLTILLFPIASQQNCKSMLESVLRQTRVYACGKEGKNLTPQFLPKKNRPHIVVNSFFTLILLH